jgi:hypothetical protein
MLPLPFSEYFSGAPTSITSLENEKIRSILDEVDTEFTSKKYILGMCIDFALLSQSLIKYDESLKNFDSKRDRDSLFKKFPRKTHKGTKELNSLTVSANGKDIGIRKFEEYVKNYFHSAGYMSYPSAYVYNTGQWQKFQNILDIVYSLSETGRKTLITKLISFAEDKLKQSSVRVTEEYLGATVASIFDEYPMSASDENAGLTFQAICYGIVCVLYPRLSVSAASVRTGSRRQSRIGDIDLFSGDRLSVTAEVKDLHLSEENAEKQISQFYGDVKNLSILPIIFCRSKDEWIERQHPEITFLSIEELKLFSRIWDGNMQESFISYVKYYLSQIECNESARQRFDTYTATFLEK